MLPLALRPADFALHYTWTAGSMQPPAHYSVRVQIRANGSGTVQMTPDYAGPDVPTWSRPVQLGTEAVDALYSALRQAGLFSPDWQTTSEPPRVGGSVWSVTAIADGQETTVSSRMVRPEGARPAALREAIWEAVPRGLRIGLAIRRKVYGVRYRRRR